MNMMSKMEAMDAVQDVVPARYRGVWRRSLLEAPGVHDTTTTVFWLQCGRWHADIRIPAARPDFSQTRSLDECNAEQLAWLARQQGFAGITEVVATPQAEICSWHRLVDYQPPAATPDAGVMRFEPEKLVETGVHGVYLEDWHHLPDSAAAFAVLQKMDAASNCTTPKEFVMIAGVYVMHVRERSVAWPEGIVMADIAQIDDAQRLLDFEISFGRRNASGWRIEHSTLPWLENKQMEVSLLAVAEDELEMSWNGVSSQWKILEWEAPR
ncbi:hypothetical protein [Herminiimonas arsenitoxidans]|uniref:hypothetical protein n=1 Tax=Herminiimonas arsenitoxidans TaxID=1809410 RepID=UPI000970DBBA|nr:hypothetical protein [Herminiimonas arsenitoxidans]